MKKLERTLPVRDVLKANVGVIGNATGIACVIGARKNVAVQTHIRPVHRGFAT